MKTCPETTSRMLELIKTHADVHLTLFAATLAAHGDRIDDDMTFQQAGDKARHAAYKLRKEAKTQRSPLRSAFREVGSLDRVDWVAIAYATPCSINPSLERSAGHGTSGL